MTNKLCFCSASEAPPICVSNPPFGNSLFLNYKNPIFLMFKADLLNPALWRASLGTQIRLALINLIMISPLVFGFNIRT